MSRMSLWSRNQRPMGMRSSSVKEARRRSVRVERVVVAFGLVGIK